MKPRRLKVEFYDSEGVRHSITVDGPVTRDKVGKILDLVEVMSGTPRPAVLALSPRKFDRLAGTVLSRLKEKSFTSNDAKRTFETAFGERIPLSTVSTYLSRLAERGVLERQQQAGSMIYRLSSQERPQPLDLPRAAPPS